MPIHKIFNYCGGSSVGTLITSGLLLSDDEGVSAKYTAHQLYDLFYSKMTSCFTWTYWSYTSTLFGLLGPVYTSVGLRSIISECCGDAQMSQLLKPIIYPSYDTNSNKNYYFDKVKNKDLKVADVILSCTAVPTLFPSHVVNIDEKEHDFIDSGLISQSSMRLVLLEAIKNHPNTPKDKILMLNIGTGSFTMPKAGRDGYLYWIPNIASTFINASYENEIFEMSMILDKNNICILDVPLDYKYYQMDNISQNAIDYYINTTDQWIKDNQQLIDNFCDKLMINKGL